MNARIWTSLLLTFLVAAPWGCAKSRMPLAPSTRASSPGTPAPGVFNGSGQTILLWNRLGSDEEVTHSVIGPDGQIVGGLAYPAGQFGNGFSPLPRAGDRNLPDNYIRFDGLALGPQGCVEFWYQPTWSDWTVGHIVELFYYGKPGSPGTGLSAQYNDWQGYLSFGAGDVQGVGIQKSVIPDRVPQWSTTRPFHVAVSWDGSASAVADRLRVFFDGTEVTTLVFQQGDPRLAAWSADMSLWLATRVQPGDWNRHPWEGGEGVMDNLKVSNYAKTDFSDRFQEGPLRTVAVDLLPGACPNPFNVRSQGMLPAAILGAGDFSVADVDVQSLRLNGVAPLASRVQDLAGPPASQADCACPSVGPDGQLDLGLSFDRAAIAQTLGDVEDGATVTLVLTGRLQNGWLIEGRDCLRIIRKPAGSPRLPTDPIE